MFLFPESMLKPRTADEHFAPEASELRWLGQKFTTVSLEDLARGEDPAYLLRRLPEATDEDHELIYRGWMLPPEQYALLTAVAEAKGWRMAASAEQYQRAHELPGWYDALRAFTPATVIGATPEDAVAQAREAGWMSAVVRDFSKSMKHAWEQACFIPNLASDHALTVVRNFERLREDVVGGFVLREFEEWTAVEARSWWRRGTCVLITSHPDTPGELPDSVQAQGLAVVPEALTEAVKSLDLGFCTVDLVISKTGELRVVELGDGGVSDRPSSTEPEEFLQALLSV